MKVYEKNDRLWGYMRTDTEPKGKMFLCSFGAFFFFAVGVASLFCEIGIFPFLISSAIGGLMLYARHCCYNAWDNFCSEMIRAEEEKKRKEEAAKKAAEEAFRKEHPHYREEQFYKECKKAKINNVTDAANIARLQLVAKKCEIVGGSDKLIAMYRLGQEQIEAAKITAQAEKAKAEETVLEKESKRYISYVGREKTIKMLKDELAPYREQLAECKRGYDIIRDGTQAIYDANKQKEHDWALHGGIASGLAGGAAGLATAIDVQNKNAQIRSYNDALLRQSVQMEFALENQRREMERELQENVDWYKEQIKAQEMKLVGELPENELLELLMPRATVRVSSSGAARITVKMKATKGLKIFDSVSAVVDGTVKVHLLHEGKKVGYAYATLPMHGAVNDCSIKTVCVNPKVKAEKYSVEFEPYHLWAIEC